MIHVDSKPRPSIEGATMADYLEGKATTKRKIQAMIEVVKSMPIHGCITGSCFVHFRSLIMFSGSGAKAQSEHAYISATCVAHEMKNTNASSPAPPVPPVRSASVSSISRVGSIAHLAQLFGLALG